MCSRCTRRTRAGSRSAPNSRRPGGLVGEGRDAVNAWTASLQGNVVTLTVTNSSMTEPRETEIAVRGGAGVHSVRATTLAAHGVHDVNSFAHPDTVQPSAPHDVAAGTSPLVYTFPPASVTKLEIALG